MSEKREDNEFLRSISRRRLQVLRGKDSSYFHVSKEPENLSAEEYNKRLEELKKMGNFC
ncbi:MAG: hypothetical protein GXZ07_10880 [Firmicutes bacterium]|nr:hypothetical protein [Bacillota bacterium]